MITNPNTLGLWDEHIQEIVDAVHEAGGLVYNDGANFNAILGIARSGDLGIDIMHFNLHKTFSTPHGGGGPGAGPVGVRKGLEDYLPGQRVRRVEEDGEVRYEFFQPEQSIGRLHAFHGNFGMFVRAYTYIRMHGAAGLRLVSEDAVLAANYIRASLRDLYDLPYGDRTCMHETVFSATRQKAQGVRALDIAKRILDFGIHPPTVYFPLVVPEALMIEPTETESKESLDYFIGGHAPDRPGGRRNSRDRAERAAQHRVRSPGRGRREPQPQPALAPGARGEAGGHGHRCRLGSSPCSTW